MTTEEVKEKIKSKFGTIQIFANTVGMDRNTVSGILQSGDSELLEALSNKADEFAAKVDSIINDRIIEDMKKAIKAKGGLYKFCEDNPEFKSSTVAAITGGKRKTITKKVRALMDTLNVK